jgi:hypothetical protein
MAKLGGLIALVGLLTVRSDDLSSTQALWDDYSTVFSARLASTFRSSYVLNGAHQQALSKLDASSYFGCSKYLDGENLGEILDLF